MDRYSYKELREAAIKNPTFENCQALAEWLDRYDITAWNGECYDLDDGIRMFPIFWPDKDNPLRIDRYEVR